MRITCLTDIHANLPALDAVLAAVGTADAVWVLGDVVGYGPDPDAVVERLREIGAVVVRGNHDAAAIGAIPVTDFNADARAAAEWTARTIGAETRAWLAALPETRVEGDFTLAHGSPRDPTWEYVHGRWVAEENLAHFSTPYAIVGHTHVPCVFRRDSAEMVEILPGDGARLTLDARRCIINPGGVGQPRDGDPRACAMTLETETRTLTWQRIAYPIAETQERMRAAGLPSRLVARLAYGQ
ncbi:MAG: metallophosphoesterase family protein [Chloroflexota bacterium]